MTTVTISESPITVAATEEVVTVSVSSQEVSVSVTEGASVDHDHDDDYEPNLGNPGTDGYVLSSTAAGVRSWIELMSGGVEFPWQPDTSGEYDILQDESGNAMLTVDTSLDRMTFDPGPSAVWQLKMKRGTSTDAYRGFEMSIKEHANTWSGLLMLPASSSPFGYDVTQMLFSAGTSSSTRATIFLQANTSGSGKAIIGTTTTSRLYIAPGGADKGYIDTSAFRLYAGLNMIFDVGNGLRPYANGSAWPLVQDASGNQIITIDTVSKLVKLIGCPTSDPAVAGAIWSDGGTLKISAG